VNHSSATLESALVAFKARNARCYRDEANLSLQATRLANAEVVREVRTRSKKSARLLPVAGVFGANASGKSALLKAMGDMRAVVVGSLRKGRSGGHSDDEGRRIFRRPFLLDPKLSGQPSSFKIELILDGVRWQYGFEISDTQVLREFAYYYPRGRQSLIFDRDAEQTSFGAAFRPLRASLQPWIRKDALLLSICGVLREPRIGGLLDWIDLNFQVADFTNRGARSSFTANWAKIQPARIRNLLQAADLGLTGIEVVKPDAEAVQMMEKLHEALRNLEPEGSGEQDHQIVVENIIRLTHSGSGVDVSFDPMDESVGTQVWLALIGPVIEALDRGSLLLVDELDASLHPLLAAQILKLFQIPEINQRCAQLIFNTHDTALLDGQAPYGLGRDQIWLTEKGRDGAAELYSLADFRGRFNDTVARRYLHGRYGAIPELDPADFKQAALSGAEA